MLGKKSSEKSVKNHFYIRTNNVPKNGGENARNNFSRNTRIVRPKIWGKKSSQRVRKSYFYISTNTVTKKLGEKTRETIFPETQE